MNNFRIHSIGRPALNALASSTECRIFGNTSRGLFLELASDGFVFISLETYRGPLTLNLSSPVHGLAAPVTGERGRIAGLQLFLPDSGISFSWQAADIWQPSAPPTRQTASKEQIASALAPLDDPLLSAMADPGEFHPRTDLERRIAAVCGQIRSENWEEALASIEGILGRGAGLTPEGDDFLIGLSLAWVRTGARGYQHKLVEEIIRMAPGRTTGLSASLLACAAEGLADERLMEACDALAANLPEAGAAMQTLLGWGATSGRMALAGISAVLLEV